MSAVTRRLALPLAVLALAACAPPEDASELRGTSGRFSTEPEDDTALPKRSSESEDVKAVPSSPPAATVPAAPPAIDVSFAGADKQTFEGINVARVCSDRGAHHSNATFLDATSLSLVRADEPSRVVAKLEGEDFQKLRSALLESGRFEVPVDPTELSTDPKELAIVMGGDERFASPKDCGKPNLRPGSAKQRDVEEFPNANVMLFNTKIGGTGCGIVGFVEAYYDAEAKKVVARPSSQLLLAADDEGRAGFPKGSYYPGCDGHDSPLVLDLGSRGVSLGAPLADIFDVDGDGTRDASPWVVSEDTPFLVRDANGNGVVDGVDEMFGNRTRAPSGLRTSANGFDALAAWDDAGDGVIDAKDAIWSSLRLWFDRNHDGRTDPGELESLEARGVASISLGFVSVTEKLFAGGHAQGAVRQRGGATMTDGRVVTVVDVWFDRRF